MFLRQNTAVWMLTGRDAAGHPWPNDTTRLIPCHWSNSWNAKARSIPMKPRCTSNVSCSPAPSTMADRKPSAKFSPSPTTALMPTA